MNQATYTRWRRYGHDRVYVTGADGVRLGWHDVTADTSNIERADRTEEFHAALERWRGAGTVSTTPRQRTGAASAAQPTQQTRVDHRPAAQGRPSTPRRW